MKRKENETYIQYIKRITECCDNKQISYTEWGDYLLGEKNTYSSDNLRKGFYIVSKLLDEIDDNIDVTEFDLLEHLQELKNDIEKEKIKLQTLNIEKKRYDRSQSRQQLFYEYIKQYKEYLPLPEFSEIKNNKNKNIEYILTLSDIHYGANFVSMNNIYSPTIAKERFEILTGHTIDFIKDKNLDKIKVVGLGDAIQGILRISDLKLNDATVVKSVVEVSRLIAQYLNTISKFCNVEYYNVPFANHTQIRVLGAKAGELADEDLEYVIGNYIKDLCSQNERIKVYLANDNQRFIEISSNANFNIIAMHGNEIKNVEDAIKDISMITGSMVDYLLLGHFHNGKEIPTYEGVFHDCEVLISPSFVGSDPYSDSISKGSKASVKIYGIDDLYGHTETYKIILN